MVNENGTSHSWPVRISLKKLPHSLLGGWKKGMETLWRGILLQESQAGRAPLFKQRNLPQSDGLLYSLTSPAVICFLQETRLKEGIVRLQPQEEPLRSELLSGKFTVLVRVI